MLLHPEVLGGVVFYGVAANICYCGGLAIESYLYLLGVRSRRVMPLLFVIGTFFAVVLTFVIGTTEGTVFLEHMPN